LTGFDVLTINFPGVVKRRLACLLVDVLQGEIEDKGSAIALLSLIITELETAENGRGTVVNRDYVDRANVDNGAIGGRVAQSKRNNGAIAGG
jgi:hypothetical protein